MDGGKLRRANKLALRRGSRGVEGGYFRYVFTLPTFTVTQMLSANQSTRYCIGIPRFSHHIAMYLEYSMNDYRDCCIHLGMTAHFCNTISLPHHLNLAANYLSACIPFIVPPEAMNFNGQTRNHPHEPKYTISSSMLLTVTFKVGQPTIDVSRRKQDDTFDVGLMCIVDRYPEATDGLIARSHVLLVLTTLEVER